MTQKELLYLEDAVGHEKNTMAYLEYAICNIEDDLLLKFLQSELEKHSVLIKKISKELKECSNE